MYVHYFDVQYIELTRKLYTNILLDTAMLETEPKVSVYSSHSFFVKWNKILVV